MIFLIRRLIYACKSTSIDELDNYAVKITADIIAEPLHHIVTLSILQNKFPSCWKYGKIIPLHKKNNDPAGKKLQACDHLVSCE